MPRTCQDAAPSQYAMHLPVCHASMPRTLQYATHRNPRGFEATEDTGLYRHVRSHEVLGVSPPEVTGFWESHFQEVRGRQSEVPRSPEFRGPPKPRCLRSFIFKGFFPAHWQTVRGSHVSKIHRHHPWGGVQGMSPPRAVRRRLARICVCAKDPAVPTLPLPVTPPPTTPPRLSLSPATERVRGCLPVVRVLAWM